LLCDRISNEWKYWEQFLYIYNEEHLLLSSIWQEGLDDEWKNRGRVMYEYDKDNNNKLFALNQWWENNAWKDATLYEYNYDEHGNCLSGDLWKWKNNEWVDDYAFDLKITYNNTQCTIGGEYYCHNISASYVKTPKPEVNIESIKQDVSSIKIYPNPTMGILQIVSESVNIHKIDIFNVLGKKVLTQKAKNGRQKTINISHLPTGMYFVRITTETGTVTQKVVKR
jgi:hypothetical protein